MRVCTHKYVLATYACMYAGMHVCMYWIFMYKPKWLKKDTTTQL